MAEPRTYVVGLPVIITVDQDGRTVAVSVDLSEAGGAIAEEPTEGFEPAPDGKMVPVVLFTEAEQDLDVDLVEELYDAKAPESFTMGWQ